MNDDCLKLTTYFAERGLVTSEMVPALAVLSHEARSRRLRLARHRA